MKPLMVQPELQGGLASMGNGHAQGHVYQCRSVNNVMPSWGNVQIDTI